MVVYSYREQADNENFALSGAVVAPVWPRSKWPFVAELDRLRFVEPLVSDFDHAFNHLNIDGHYMFNGGVIAPVLPIARPYQTPALVPI